MIATTRKKVDRRVSRNRNALLDALMALMREKGFEATNVAEIAERADVSRSTFYAHYDGKEDLLLDAIERLRGFLGERLRQSPPDPRHPALAFALPMLEHAADHRDLWRAMAGKRSGTLVREAIESMLGGFVRKALAGRPSPPPALRPAAVAVVTGGFISLMSWWADSRSTLGPKELDALFRSLVKVP